jgi:tetratricopeptide (TPR) repeat protein
MGVVAGEQGDPSRQQANWEAFLRCDASEAVKLERSAAPQNQALARLATELYPQESQGWFWLAEISAAQHQEEQAIQQYQQVLRVDPLDSLAWCRLGTLFSARNPQQAEEAYLQCCYLGDPGSNGCYNAGHIAEEQGNLLEAIRIYRLSHYQVALQRADDLEKQVTPAP